LVDQAVAGRRRAQLDDRLKGYHDVGLDQVLEVIAYLRDEGDSVIAGGSLAMSLGNRLSDLDLVVIGDQTIESSRVPLEHFVGSLRVDVWKMSRELIQDVFDRAEASLARADRLDRSFRNVDDETNLKLLHRVAFGIPVDGGGLEPSSTRGYATVAQEAVIREYAERMREHCFLASVADAAGRPALAALNAREAVEAALHATIAARGLPFSGDKWLQERLANGFPELESRYVPFAALPDPIDESAPFVAAALAECSALTGITLGLDAISPGCAWLSTDLRPTAIGSARMLLSVRAGALWELTPPEAETWARLERRAGEAGGDGHSAQWRCDGCDPAETALCLDLYARGAIELKWLRGVPAAELRLDAGPAA
jgi:hypothetical protein